MNKDIKTVPITLSSKQHEFATKMKNINGKRSWEDYIMSLVIKDKERRDKELQQ